MILLEDRVRRDGRQLCPRQPDRDVPGGQVDGGPRHLHGGTRYPRGGTGTLELRNSLVS